MKATQNYEILLKVAEQGSFKKVADEMDYTQAGIAYIIRSLEEEMGVPLFIRRHNRLTLSPEGSLILPHIREICNAEIRMENLIRDIRNLDAGILRLGIFTSVYIAWFPSLIKTFNARYPKLEVRVKYTDDQNDLFRAVLEGDLDVSFAIAPVKPGLIFDKLKDDPMVVIISKDDPMKDCELFTAADLQERPYVDCLNGTFAEVDRVFTENHAAPKPILYGENDYGTLALVAGGLGYAVTSGLFASCAGDDRIITKRTEVPVIRQIGLVTCGQHPVSAAAQRFIELTHDMYGEK